MSDSITNINLQLRQELSPVLAQLPWEGQAREILGERTQLFQGSITDLEGFSKSINKGLEEIKRMQLAINEDALDQLMKMNFMGLPGLEAIVKANLMQHHCGINHSQMLLIFDRACKEFEKGDIDLAFGIFMALLFLNPFIAPLWFCVARAFETKKKMPQSLFSYAICDLLTRGNLYSALDATECLVASGNKRLADTLLREIEFELRFKKLASQIHERATQLRKAIEFLE